MRTKLSDLPAVGYPAEKLGRIDLDALRLEQRRAKAEVAKFVGALAERGLPTQVRTPKTASEAERRAHRLARLGRQSRSFYRHLLAWRRYQREVGAEVRRRQELKRAAKANARLVRQVVVDFHAERRSAQRAAYLRELKAARSYSAKYAVALRLHAKLRAAAARKLKLRADPWLEAFMLVQVLELRAHLPAGTCRKSKHTDVSLEEARTVLASTVDTIGET